MADEEKLKLGKGVAFVKSRLKRLPQADETWEADFQALPKPIEQAQTHYLGMVVTAKDGSLLAETTVHGRPSVNDLATLLAHAMRRPLDGDARRPRLVHLRGHHQWRGLFPHLEEIGIGVEVSVERGSPSSRRHTTSTSGNAGGTAGRDGGADRRAGEDRDALPCHCPVGEGVRLGRDRRAGTLRLRRQGVARGRHPGRGRRPGSLAEAMAALEAGLVRWFEEQGVEIDGP